MTALRSTIKLYYLILANLVFLPTILFQFAYDDFLQIVNNKNIVDAHLSFASLSTLFTQPTPGLLYRPIVLCTYWVTSVLSGLTPWVYHAENILLQIACTILIYVLGDRVLNDKRIAGVAALLFALHPLHVEVVANIIGRTELLGTAFSIITLLAVIEIPKDASILKKLPYYVLALGSFLFAVLSKESAFTVLLLLPLFIVATSDEKLPAIKKLGVGIFRTIPFVLAGILVILLRKSVLGAGFLLHQTNLSQIFWENPLVHLDTGSRFISAIKIVGDYIWLLLFPWHLSADYSRMPSDLLNEVYSLDGTVSIATFLLFLGSLYWQRREKFTIFGIWVLLSFSITSNIFFLSSTIKAERLVYFPSVGFLLYASATVQNLWQSRGYTFADLKLIAGAIMAVFFLRTAVRLPVWYDDESLKTETYLDNPTSPKAAYNYGLLLLDQKKDLTRSKDIFLKVLDFYPDHILSLLCLSDIALAQQQYQQMVEWDNRILAIDPNQAVIKKQLADFRQWQIEHQ